MKNHILLLLLILMSCSDKTSSNSNNVANKEIVGIYKNREPAASEKRLYKAWSYVNGSTLALSKDNTYLYKTCGMLIHGTWEKENDSLFLNVKNHKFLLDSLNLIKKEAPPRDFFVYLIKDNGLISNMKSIDDPEKRILNNLVKE